MLSSVKYHAGASNSMPHTRTAAGKARRKIRRNLFASLMENCLGTEAGRNVTAVWDDGIPVGFVDQALLKPDRVHGGIVRYEPVYKDGILMLSGSMADDDALVTKTVNKRAARLSQNYRRR